MTGKNWRLHWAWPVILKYITAPAVGLVFTFAYPKFRDAEWYHDPPYFYSFVLMHVVMIFIVGLFIFPRFFNFLIPATRRDEGTYEVQPQVSIGEIPAPRSTGVEAGIVEPVPEAHSSLDEKPDTINENAVEPKFIDDRR